MSFNNYPHLTARVFNQPLLMDPTWAQGFFNTLGERLGAPAEADTGAGLTTQEALNSTGGNGRDSRPYRVEQGIAVLGITGTLVHKFGYMKPMCGMTGYDGIVSRLRMAINDPDVNGVLLDIDSPGGEVSGAFDTADLIARMGKIKPIWALAGDMATSAAYLLASACSRRLITQTGTVGSIGVIVAHRNVEKQMEKNGVAVTLIHAGARKVDGNPYKALPEDVRKDIQARVDETRVMFAQKVSDNTGLSLKAVLATEAKTYDGKDAVKNGLADEMINYADAVNTMSLTVKPRREPMNQKNENTMSADVNQIAATQERERIMGIMSCNEAKGREEMAQALALTPGMSIDAARTILQSAPAGAQVRTQTALDALMEAESPEALTTGAGSVTAQEKRLSGLMKHTQSMSKPR
ncbi:S49 family peptidase [Enterobacter sp. ASE]|uniref:S49 family peptidase n=1 Tax=Enterobacter sp. ASE TaxID=2905968 RepID=UPI001E572957|nr:S49 family peptidase [Enterobacter sp. ASE]MCE3118708.1 S49 family peptidase [Enterobacter sp. ASE]